MATNKEKAISQIKSHKHEYLQLQEKSYFERK